jgi:hypothetical protein
MTEYGYSAFSTESEMDRAGAILNTEAVAEFLTRGGSGAEAFFYGTEPSNIDQNQNCESWGDNTLFLADDNRHIIARNATYHAARMLTTMWADSSGGNHSILATTVAGPSGEDVPVSAYAIRRPDNRVAVLMVNRDPAHEWVVDLRGLRASANSTLDLWRLSGAEYDWHANAERGYAKPDTGPRRVSIVAGAPLVLPPYSIVVIREH